jgi:hypothetical protein
MILEALLATVREVLFWTALSVLAGSTAFVLYVIYLAYFVGPRRRRRAEESGQHPLQVVERVGGSHTVARFPEPYMPLYQELACIEYQLERILRGDDERGGGACVQCGGQITRRREDGDPDLWRCPCGATRIPVAFLDAVRS